MDKNTFISLTKYLSIPVLIIIILFFIVSSQKKTNNNTTYIPITKSITISHSKASIIRKGEKNEVLNINNHNFSVKKANTTLEQNVGLMEKTKLSINQGMIFLFKHISIHDFWMAHTQIPLTMVFVSQDNKIEEIINAMPCKSTKCIEYIPKVPSSYVLELNPNAINKFKIKVGDSIKFI